MVINEAVSAICTAAGVITLMAAILTGVAFAMCWLWEQGEKIVYRRRMKHRFDKPPHARCYCIDCRYYASTYAGAHCGYCRMMSRRQVSEAYFCKWAVPNKKQPENTGGDGNG